MQAQAWAELLGTPGTHVSAGGAGKACRMGTSELRSDATQALTEKRPAGEGRGHRGRGGGRERTLRREAVGTGAGVEVAEAPHPASKRQPGAPSCCDLGTGHDPRARL